MCTPVNVLVKLVVPIDYFHPVCVSCLWARCVQCSMYYFALRQFLRRMLPPCNVLASRSKPMAMPYCKGFAGWIVSLLCFHLVKLQNPHIFILFSGKHFHPLENLSCFSTASWCQSWGANSPNHRHYSNCSQTTALGKGTIRVTFGFCTLLLATFILAHLTGRSSGIYWQKPKIWTVMDSWVTVITWAVYNLVKETKCKQEDRKFSAGQSKVSGTDSTVGVKMGKSSF